MNKHISLVFILFVTLLGAVAGSAQPLPQTLHIPPPKLKAHPADTTHRPASLAVSHAAFGHLYLSYVPVPGDPLGAHIYKLDNGLMVYLSVNKSEPRVQTMIAVRAGSKMDPPDATGLAHYLEHLLFKGTDKFGSLDYSKEKPYLDEIENLYEVYRGTKDSVQRVIIYHQIDSVSGVAAKWAIANEYDKLVSSLGATGTNAYTSDEQTVYLNDIPSNEIDKWLTIEAERYRHPVIRLFHTELEAVYEEKNRGLDNDENLAWEALMAALFQKHPYGQQTTIGTIEHLKNPSIKKIEEFYSKWYVPNNMAIAMAGDFDPDSVIRSIIQKFSVLKKQPLAHWDSPEETPLLKPAVREVYGPDAEFVELAWRLPGVNTHEAKVAAMMDMLLSNSTAGLIDLNLNQQQKLLKASSEFGPMNDYSAHVLTGKANEGQSLDQVRDLLLSQIDSIKKGHFDASLLPAIINDLTMQNLRKYERNSGRADEMMSAFIHKIEWPEDVAYIDSLSKITKQEIVDFANKYYSDNYAIVYKRTGDHRNVVKVTKPPITPVEVNRTAQSDFLKTVEAMSAKPTPPHFLDYKKDITDAKLSSGVPVYYLHNDENQRFTMSYVIDIGKRNDKKLRYALDYLDFAGIGKNGKSPALSPSDVKKTFFALGASLNVSTTDDEVHISLTGLQKNFDASVKLLESELENPASDETTLKEFVSRKLKEREDIKKDRHAILWTAMRDYAVYGKVNPQTYDLSNSDLQSLTVDDLTSRIHSVCAYPHRVLYYGPESVEGIVGKLNDLHKVTGHLTVPAPIVYTRQETSKNKVYFVDYDMAQAEVVMLSKGMPSYDSTKAPEIALYNEYYGGSMASVTFQTIRESKALAYAVFSSYAAGQKKDDPYYVLAYVGSQADKNPETMKSMFELLNDMPRADKLFEDSKTSLINSLSSERTTREDVLWSYEKAKKLGLDHDIREKVYNTVPSLTFEQVADFQKQNISGHQYAVCVLGSKSKLDMKDLAQYGDVEELSLNEIFGW
jgi:predicted Zn-dependent peptidase